MSRRHLTDPSDRLSDSRASSPSEDGPVAEVSDGGQWAPGSFAKVLRAFCLGKHKFVQNLKKTLR